MVTAEREMRVDSRPKGQELEVEFLQALISGIHPGEVLEQLELTPRDATGLLLDIKERLFNEGYGEGAGVEKAISLWVRSGVLEVDKARIDEAKLKKISIRRRKAFEMIGDGLTVGQMRARFADGYAPYYHELGLRRLFNANKYELVAIAASSTPLKEPERSTFTPRQAEIFQAIVEGNSHAEIANKFGISIKTVEAHKYQGAWRNADSLMTNRQARVKSVIQAIDKGELIVHDAQQNAYLTNREFEVANLLFREAKTPTEILTELCVSPKTIGAHTSHIFKKLDAKTFMQALAKFTVLQRDDTIETRAGLEERKRNLEEEIRTKLRSEPLPAADASFLQGLIDGEIVGRERSAKTREFVDRFYGNTMGVRIGLTAGIIRGVSEGQLNPRGPHHNVPLTATEERVANFLIKGVGPAQIAEKLICAVKTVEAHESHIFAKLGAKNYLHFVAILTAFDIYVGGVEKKQR